MPPVASPRGSVPIAPSSSPTAPAASAVPAAPRGENRGVTESPLVPCGSGSVPASSSPLSQAPPPLPPGLVNLRSTCFLNAILQCVVHAPTVSSYLTSRSHQQRCPHRRTAAKGGRSQSRHSGRGRQHRAPPFCAACALEEFACYRGSQPFSPTLLVTNLPAIASTLDPGRQHDAHEFLRFMIQHLYLSFSADVEPGTSSLVDSWFGGSLRSLVSCTACNSSSVTTDLFYDLSLELHTGTGGAVHLSVHSALTGYFQTEPLSGYKCDACNASARRTMGLPVYSDLCVEASANKCLRVSSPPNILTLHLKRFQFVHNAQQKLSHHVKFDTELDLSPFTTSGSPASYSLFAVVVHDGPSGTSGHYYTYSLAPTSSPATPELSWLCFDDTRVKRVSIDVVLASHAYLLFYSLNPSPLPPLLRPRRSSSGCRMGPSATPSTLPPPSLLPLLLPRRLRTSPPRHYRWTPSSTSPTAP